MTKQAEGTLRLWRLGEDRRDRQRHHETNDDKTNTMQHAHMLYYWLQVGRTLRVGGWIKTGRTAGGGDFAFLEVNDGSTFANLQVRQICCMCMWCAQMMCAQSVTGPLADPPEVWLGNLKASSVQQMLVQQLLVEKGLVEGSSSEDSVKGVTQNLAVMTVISYHDVYVCLLPIAGAGLEGCGGGQQHARRPSGRP